MKLFKCQILTLTSVPTLKLTSVNRALFLAYQIRFDKFIALSRFPYTGYLSLLPYMIFIMYDIDKLDPVGSTVPYEMRKLCTGSV